MKIEYAHILDRETLEREHEHKLATIDYNNYKHIFMGKVRKVKANYNLNKIEDAYDFMQTSHKGQMRKSGEPYISHPISVAEILLEIKMDSDTIIAALLHDVVEDCDVTFEELERRYGEDVAKLVDGATKVSKVNLGVEGTGHRAMKQLTKDEENSENIRKMLIDMSNDNRVIVIKLADRLHNMQTLGVFRRDKQIRIALETIEFHAPIAHRVGMTYLKNQLENYALFYYDRYAYNAVVSDLEFYTQNRFDCIEAIMKKIESRLSDINPVPLLEGRVKSIYSLCQKYYLTRKNIEQIYDVYAIRVITETNGDCYSVLGILHDMFTPLTGSEMFKDYIANKKDNGYQSIHTILLGREGQPFEVQIRTRAMHEIAQFGVAAHWRYKIGEAGIKEGVNTRFDHIREMIELQSTSSDVDNIAEAIKRDFTSDEVHVVTPKGDHKSLRKGSTVIDFAYAVHTNIGNNMTGAKIHGKTVSLSQELNTGDVIEIIVSNPAPGPNRSWLDYAKTSLAKSKIRHWLKNERRDDNVKSGKTFVESILKREGATVINNSEQSELEHSLLKLAQKHNYNNLDDFYAAIGYGEISTNNVSIWLKTELGGATTSNNTGGNVATDKYIDKIQKSKQAINVEIEGFDNCLVKFANCCNPLPNDEIVGFITKGHGVSVHISDCVNIKSRLTPDKLEENKEKIVKATWLEDAISKTTSYKVTLEILATNRDLLLKDAVEFVAESKVNILNNNSRILPNGNAVLHFTFDILSMEQLGKLIKKLEKIESVINVKRKTK
ncbi:MAG: bifunctional (p)ppGpp synthetase/guanosine-3',5'-bis(diphosphate) 3'-pyrophosphohydrolase [Oscillospiraceae bacterium]|nr:bifunctional (p)ppGpp synthetase/guanosine-3',5'-bis(diphosphate) 3'-pyrophosphohydrolase [Oscillospiraceae bacterium]